ncbi:hypothetical protein, partial [Nocardia puris]|uniref:hypothetical protein n=1 Tax=Nocardia puris TaxID=208602 RepID=UPI001E51BADB
MSDTTPDLIMGLTRAERDAADGLELTIGVDVLLQHTNAGWVASLLTPDGAQHHPPPNDPAVTGAAGAGWRRRRPHPPSPRPSKLSYDLNKPTIRHTARDGTRS